MTVLTEAEAAALVAKRPDAGSSSSYAANIGSTSSSLLHSSSPPLQLQQPPFKLRGLDRGLQRFNNVTFALKSFKAYIHSCVLIVIGALNAQ